jgi:glucose-1-phosphate thymidylyltransferase
MLISTPKDLPSFKALFGDGSKIGLSIDYAVQNNPDGIAQSFIIAQDFMADNSVALILGDNIFYGIDAIVKDTYDFKEGALIFGYYMKNPERYGVIEFNNNGDAVSIEEKPEKPKSNYAVTGLYLYDSDVVKIAKSLEPSARGELEITDVNNTYLEMNKLRAVKLGRGISWLDTGTFDSLLAAGNFISTVEQRQGMKIGCIEEIAFRKKFIDRRQFEEIIESTVDTDYKKYLEDVVREV